MKLTDIINKTYSNTRIRVTIREFGMNFTTEHSTEYYADLEGADRAILDRDVRSMTADENALVVILE